MVFRINPTAASLSTLSGIGTFLVTNAHHHGRDFNVIPALGIALAVYLVFSSCQQSRYRMQTPDTYGYLPRLHWEPRSFSGGNIYDGRPPMESSGWFGFSRPSSSYARSSSSYSSGYHPRVGTVSPVNSRRGNGGTIAPAVPPASFHSSGTKPPVERYQGGSYRGGEAHSTHYNPRSSGDFIQPAMSPAVAMNMNSQRPPIEGAPRN
jgi:hypothetical protein